MATDIYSNEQVIAELIAQLGRLVYSDGLSSGLTSAQWTALRYFARANRFSCTVSAFAEYHGTTRGTASQTVKSLVAQDYLEQVRCDRDGRSKRLAPTNKGHAALLDDPFTTLVDAIHDLSSDTQQTFSTSLEYLLGFIARERGKQAFGICLACHYLQDTPCCMNHDGHYCGFAGEQLQASDLAKLCINFEPDSDSVMKQSLRKKCVTE